MQRVIGPDFNNAAETKGFGIERDPQTHNAQNMELESKKHYCSVIQKIAETHYGMDKNINYIINSDESDIGNITIRLQSANDDMPVSERITTAEKVSAMAKDIKRSAKAVNIPFVCFNGIGLLFNQMEASIDGFSKVLNHLAQTKLGSDKDIETHLVFADAIRERSEKYIPKHYMN